MATIGDVWDSTTDVLAGRAREIVPLAIGALLVPAIVGAAIRASIAGPAAGAGAGAIAAIVTLVVAVVGLWGRLAITAVALDPGTTAADARSQAARGLLPLIGVLFVLAAAGIVLLLPLVFVLTAAGLDYAAMRETGQFTLPALTGASMWFARLYSVALVVLALWVVARIKLLVTPIVLAERRVIGAIGRAVALTRGMTWRLIGVVLLYYVVLWVCVLAVTAVAGLVFRLMLGADARATVGLLATVFGATVGTAFDTIAQVFAARLYAALTGGTAPAAA